VIYKTILKLTMTLVYDDPQFTRSVTRSWSNLRAVPMTPGAAAGLLQTGCPAAEVGLYK
jgi:hypothetical protein